MYLNLCPSYNIHVFSDRLGSRRWLPSPLKPSFGFPWQDKCFRANLKRLSGHIIAPTDYTWYMYHIPFTGQTSLTMLGQYCRIFHLEEILLRLDSTRNWDHMPETVFGFELCVKNFCFLMTSLKCRSWCCAVMQIRRSAEKEEGNVWQQLMEVLPRARYFTFPSSCPPCVVCTLLYTLHNREPGSGRFDNWNSYINNIK